MGTGRWLCIDQGGQSSRAAVFDDAGRMVALGRAPAATLRPAPDRVEHAPEALSESVASAVAAALGALPDAGRALAGAALATQRSTLVCVRRTSGEALAPALSWQDRRGAAALEARAGAARGRIEALTGLKLSPHYGIGKLRWCLEHIEAVRAAAARRDLVAAPLAAFLLHRLGVGRAWQVDAVNASRLLLMDLERLQWSDELLELFGVEAGLLPSIRPCRFPYGRLRAGGIEVPLTVCTGDQPAALFCAGPPRAGDVLVNVGTGAFLQCAAGASPLRAAGLLASVGWQDAGGPLYVLEGTVNGAAAAVESLVAELGIEAPAPAALAAALRRIESAPLFLNGVSGLGSPDWVASFPSRFVGEGTPLERLAAGYESIAFLILRNLDAMRRRLTLERIVLTGGLARLDWLARRLASISGLPVHRPERAEATLEGLRFLLAGLPAAGSVRSRSAAAVFEPEADPVAASRYARWTEALEAALRVHPQADAVFRAGEAGRPG